MSDGLPIEAILDDVKQTLAARNLAIVIAPPGAGKTTRLPLAFMDAGWASGKKILIVEPRRLATRMAARRMAGELGEKVGDRVGYTVRMERRVSRRTRIELVTSGVFVRMIMDAPELPGVAGVFFDEAHERSLDLDLGLALARDVQLGLREDLRILLMSATIDGAGYSDLLGGAPILRSQGRQYPVETRYLGRSADRSVGDLRIEDRVVHGVRTALSEETGSVLAFLPGQGEIRRTAERLAPLLDDTTDLAPLYGALDGREQDAAVGPAQPGRRKVVLATSIAETSLTIEGVRVVVDGGLQRRPVYDPGAGLSRLETVRVSQAAADQRRGRAGRTEPGVCYRLWDEVQTKALQPFDQPEILDSELSGLALTLLSWGVSDPSDLIWRDIPPKTAFAEALALLTSLGAVNESGFLTDHGRRLATLPVPPRLGHMMIAGAAEGYATAAARLAALLSEPGLCGRNVDVRERLERLSRDKGSHIKSVRAMAGRWATMVGREGAPGEEPFLHPDQVGMLIGEAFRDRIAQARGAPGRFRMANGRGAWLEEDHAFAREPFLAIADVQGGGPNARILTAAPISRAVIESRFASQVEDVHETLYQSDTDTLVTRRRKQLGAVILSDIREPTVPGPESDTVLAQAVLNRGVDALPWTDGLINLRARVAFVKAKVEPITEQDASDHAGEPGDAKVWPDLGDDALLEKVDEWLPMLVAGKTRLGSIEAADLKAILSIFLPFEKMRELDRLAPETFLAPSGQDLTIDYMGGEPVVRAPPQSLFGLIEHPAVCEGRVPILFELLSPARRPIQVTRDLPGFWGGSWRDVRADLRGRYPKHSWPEDPMIAPAVSGVRRRS